MRYVRVLGVAAGLAVVAVSGAAAADDPPIYQPVATSSLYAPVPIQEWTGFYVGGSLAYEAATVTGTASGTTETWRASGPAIGIVVGANWRLDDWLLGIQTSVGWAFASGSAPSIGVDTNVSLFGSFRIRAGYIFADSWAVYATIGPAWQRVTASGATVSPAHTQVHPGVTFGAGVERALTDSMRARGEVLWSRFAELPYGGGAATIGLNRVEARISLIFNWDNLF